MAINLDHIDPGSAGGSVLIPELPGIRPRRITYHCIECEEGFSDLDLLRRHRLDQFPLRRPYLFIAGRSHYLDRYVIGRLLKPGDLHFLNGGSLPIDNAEPVCSRANVTRKSEGDHLVPGEYLYRINPERFDRPHRDPLPQLSENEKLLYTPCSVCRQLCRFGACRCTPCRELPLTEHDRENR